MESNELNSHKLLDTDGGGHFLITKINDDDDYYYVHFLNEGTR